VRAASLGREALALMRDIGGPYYIAVCLNILAWIAGEAGWGERAARLRGAWAALYESMGGLLSPLELEWIEASTALAQATLGEEAWAAALAAGPCALAGGGGRRGVGRRAHSLRRGEVSKATVP